MLVSQLLQDEDFNTTGLLPLYEFNFVISKIQIMGDEDDSNNSTLAWMKVERTYNEEVKDMFLNYRDTSYLYITLDDDKEKFNYFKNIKMWGLQRCQHIEINQFGFTFHTATVTAMGIVLCIMFQQEAETQT